MTETIRCGLKHNKKRDSSTGVERRGAVEGKMGTNIKETGKKKIKFAHKCQHL